MNTPRAAIRLVLLVVLLISCTGAFAGTLLLETDNVPQLVAFYSEVLPFVVVIDADNFAVLDHGDQRLIIRMGVSKPGRGIRLLVPVEDLGAIEQRLAAANIRYRVHTNTTGGRVLFLNDPQGTPLGLTSPNLDIAGWRGSEFVPSDRSGRVTFMVYGGIYGTWLGVGIPVALEVDSPEPFGAGVALGGLAGAWGASLLSQESMPRGRAEMISLAGWFATWQGLGWAAHADADGNAVVAAGVLSGLSGLAIAIPLTSNVSVSHGQATIMSSSSLWGGWYGIILPQIFDESDAKVSEALIGSSVGLSAAALWAMNHDIDVGRARLISLGGVLGTAVGFGTALMTQVNDAKTGFALIGFGGLLGHAAAAALTDPARSTDRSQTMSFVPQVVRGTEGEWQAGFRAVFQ